jgi:UDP-N-acetylmuramyl pentapeptide phosphotransferase/UDP-N-acetylglucosamine-1-phosphate transferase
MMVCLVGATFGFLVWNYPRGKIFAGDGGAYVWGMVIAVAVRHAGAAPPRGLALVPDAAADLPGVGDAVLHLPQARARPVARHGRRAAFPPADLPPHRARGARRRGAPLLARNNRTSPYLWMFAALSVVPAVLFWNNTHRADVLLSCCSSRPTWAPT